jgi:uncharacterized delta-60 repeat protein
MIFNCSLIKSQTARLASRMLLATVTTAVLLAAPARAVPGGLDPSFGSGGSYSFTNAQGWLGYQSAVQSTGKIVTLHSCGDYSTADVCVTRIAANGAGGIDTTFAASEPVPGIFRTGDAAQQEFATTLVVDNNDRILVAARCGPTSPCVFRLTANGALDTSFGTGGYARLSGVVTAKGLELMGDGRIAVAADCFSGHYIFCVNRLTANGQQDPTFNGGNKLNIDMSISNNQASAITTYPDGRILVTGYCDDSGSSKFCVARLTLAGALDTTFNGTGIRTYSATGQTGEITQNVRLLPGGRILLGGYCGAYGNGASRRFCAAALTDSGQPDAGFAGASYVWLNAISFTALSIGLMHVSDDGKILLVGACGSSPQVTCLVRLMPNGSLDTTFGTGGLSNAVTSVTGVSIFGIRPVPGDKLLVSALCNSTASTTAWQSCVTRFDLGATAGLHCSLDIDDDGFIKAQTDGLLWLRLMLGFRGNALTQNAVSPGAQRATATAIYDHAFTHCGVR